MNNGRICSVSLQFNFAKALLIDDIFFEGGKSLASI